MGCKISKWRKLVKIIIVKENSHSKLIKFTWMHSNPSSSVLVTTAEFCLFLKASLFILLCSQSQSNHFSSLKIYTTNSPFSLCKFKPLFKLNFSHIKKCFWTLRGSFFHFFYILYRMLKKFLSPKFIIACVLGWLFFNLVNYTWRKIHLFKPFFRCTTQCISTFNMCHLHLFPFSEFLYPPKQKLYTH